MLMPVSNPKAYRATTDELCAVTEALKQKAIPESDLPAYYRREACTAAG